MTRRIFTITFLFFLVTPALMFGQVDVQEVLQEAKSFLKNKDYAHSLPLFRQLHTQVNRQDSLFATVAYGLSSSLYYTLPGLKNTGDWQKLIDVSNEFLTVLGDDKDVLPERVQETKYWTYADLIVAHFGLGQRDKARPYQTRLYDAYKSKELPKGIDEYYNFEKIVFNDYNVWGYEQFAQLGDKETERSFSKHVYYVYSRDKDGNDKDLLFTLETVKVHKFTDNEPDYVLTRRTHSNNNTQTQSLWAYTFRDPVDYEQLHQNIMEALKEQK
jgi:hypothetical protein